MAGRFPSVGVWTEYHWHCPHCEAEMFISSMPIIGDLLPDCSHCGESCECEGITEEVRPGG